MAEQAVPASYYREVYTLGTFGRGQMSISVYIDALTVCMFCMVTLIASCIHVYSIGYMHDELAGDDYVDHEVTLADGSHLRRRGRYSRFFQYLSLFSFSMLGLVLSGNIAMTFVFWELVGTFRVTLPFPVFPKIFFASSTAAKLTETALPAIPVSVLTLLAVRNA